MRPACYPLLQQSGSILITAPSQLMANEDQTTYSNEEYTVGWICALPVEFAAAKGMLDEEHGNPQMPASKADSNSYLLGSIGNFKVVVACG